MGNVFGAADAQIIASVRARRPEMSRILASRDKSTRALKVRDFSLNLHPEGGNRCSALTNLSPFPHFASCVHTRALTHGAVSVLTAATCAVYLRWAVQLDLTWSFLNSKDVEKRDSNECFYNRKSCCWWFTDVQRINNGPQHVTTSNRVKLTTWLFCFRRKRMWTGRMSPIESEDVADVSSACSAALPVIHPNKLANNF